MEKAQQAFDELLSSLMDEEEVEVGAFAVNDESERSVRGRSVNLTDAAEDVFRHIFRNALDLRQEKKEHKWMLRPYDAIYKPEDDEVEWLPLGAVEPVAEAVERMNDLNGLSPLDESDEAFIGGLTYWGLKTGQPGKSAYVFRRFVRSAELSRNRRSALILRRGAFDRATERIFLFDNNVDCIVFKGYVFVLRKRDFRLMFEQMQKIFDLARLAAQDLHSRIPIANLDEFIEACGRDSRMADKMLAVQNRPYFDELDYLKVKPVIDEFNLGIPLKKENGRPMLIFQASPSERFKILKLVDDDYLRSKMTDLRYEVNSKVGQG